MSFREQYQIYLSFFEGELKKFCAGMNYTPKVLTESMRYSLLSGGKRVRPVLFLSALDFLGEDYTGESGFALALECIHTYSLIHDDLPAMDNDDFRRGNPSNHKVFGEANAILAGDGLLSVAFSLLLTECGRGEAYLAAAQYLAGAAGAEGMIAGQSADIFYTGKEAAEEDLFFIYINKTAKLIAAPLVMAALIGGKHVTEMEEFGLNLGVLFQLSDDILDAKGDGVKMGKTLGKDEAENKLTCVKLFGLERSQLLAEQYAGRCFSVLQKIGNPSFLRKFVSFIKDRDC